MQIRGVREAETPEGNLIMENLRPYDHLCYDGRAKSCMNKEFYHEFRI